MASSGTYAFSLNNGEAVISAFERCQLRLPSLRQEHWRSARVEMNLLLTDWSNRQVNLWKVEQISLTLVDGTATYDVPARVVMILDAYLTQNNGETNQTDLYITPISRTDYASYASKFTSGNPTSYWFDRTISPTVTTWPVINTTGYVLNYYACVQVQDAALTSGQTPDIPYLWNDALVAGLSHRLARIYAPQLEAQRKTDAMEAWTVAATQNTENVSVKLSPNLGRYYR
jgi:hypothetical protein